MYLLRMILMTVAVLIVGCGTADCKRKEVIPPLPGAQSDNVVAPKDKAPPGTRVYVYKYDGSIQCEPGRAIPPEEMAKELHGIKIYSQENRSDGLMHIQVCGSPTGMINIYQIDTTNLEKAVAKGFRVFKEEL